MNPLFPEVAKAAPSRRDHACAGSGTGASGRRHDRGVCRTRWGATVALSAALILSACGGGATTAGGTASGGHAALPTLTVAFCCTTPSVLPLEVAQQKGFFAKEGVAVHVKHFLQGSATVGQALSAGQVDIAEEMGGPDNVLRLARRGAKIKMIAALQLLDPVWLFAKPGIPDVAALRGKTVVIGGLGGPVYTFGVLLLQSGGLSLKDVKVIQNGNNTQRLGLLESGQADAAVLSMPSNFLALKQGFHSLKYIGDVITSDMEPWVATDAVLKRKPDAVLRFLKGIHDAENYIRQNPKGAAGVYVKMTKSSPASALKAIKVWIPYYSLKLNMQELKYVFKFEKRAGEWKGPLPTTAELRRYTDESFVKRVG